MTAMDAPRAPRHALPPGACDAHCHVWGPHARFPLAPDRPYDPPERDKEVLAALHRRLGIARTVIVQAIVHRTDNAILLDAIADAPADRRGIALIDDATTEAELARLHAGGVRGIRFGFVRHLASRPDMALFRRLVARIAPLGWHVQIHLDAADLDELAPELLALPVPFVIDHMGRVDAAAGPDGPAFRRLLDLLRDERGWVKVSGADRVSAAGAPFRDAGDLARRLLAAAPDRTVWGTDFPHPNPRHPVEDADLVDLLPAMGDAAALRRLLVDNPARLYGFGA